ncbi:UNVERIFIED_ORG: hypothetical protein J2W87_004975 [Pseudomonas putida]|nr:hypothetical protein [Pseudomonas putida]
MTEGKTYMHMVGVFGWKALRRYMALKRCSSSLHRAIKARRLLNECRATGGYRVNRSDRRLTQ